MASTESGENYGVEQQVKTVEAGAEGGIESSMPASRVSSQ